MDAPQKRCKKCGEIYPVTREYFGNRPAGISCGREYDIGVGYAPHWVKGLYVKVEYAEFQESDIRAGAARKPDTRKIRLTCVYNSQ